LPAEPAEVTVADGWILTPFRAAVHGPTAAAVIADVHLGYDHARQAGGEAIPDLSWPAQRQRLAGMLDRHPVRRLIVAGDLVEDGRQAEAVRRLAAWLGDRGVTLELVPGNHDRGLPPIPGVLRHDAGCDLGPWRVVHEEAPDEPRPQVAGHVHPAVCLPGTTTKVPCFLVSPRHLLLPAFSEDAAGGSVRARRAWRRDHCYAVVGDTVLSLGAVSDLGQAAAPAGRR
jgi:putative SbcD/Mre11-related phosphoesterase